MVTINCRRSVDGGCTLTIESGLVIGYRMVSRKGSTMNTYFYGKPQTVSTPTVTSDGKGTFVLHSMTDTGKVVKVFAFTAADLASLVAMSKAAPVEAAPAPAPVRKAKTTVPADLDADMAALLSLLTSMRGMDAPVKPAVRKARKATGGK